MTISLRHFIDGTWAEGGGDDLVDVNPSRPDDIIATGRMATVEEVDRAFDAASSALGDWRTAPARDRAAVLVRAAAILDANAAEWGRELAREEGKTLVEGVTEVAHAANILRYHAQEVERASGQVFESPTRGERILVVRRSVGVVGVITPFNFPISIPAWKIAPALAWGNTVVWKPAESVPVLAMRLAQACAAAGLPRGVLNLVIGTASVGAAIVSHPRIDAVTFTGSTNVGRAIAAQLAARGIPFQGELGGKNASLVLDDADLDLAAEQVVLGAFRSAGQKCTATSRLVLQEPIADEFLRRIVKRTRALVVGDAQTDGVEMGPLVDSAARDRVAAAISRAHTYAQPVFAPTPYSDAERAAGYFVPPSIFELPADSEAELWTQELFGPVLAVRRVGTAAEGIVLVNASEYGLATAVFTRNLGRALAAVEEIRVGIVHINSASAGAELHVPFGGTRGSGMGPKEQGPIAREFFTETATVYLKG